MPLMDAIDLLKHDHRIVEQMFRDYRAVPVERQRRAVVEILVRELSKHAALEELLFYPFARKAMPGAADEIEQHLRDHQGLKELLAQLDGLRAGDERTDRLLRRLRREVQHHVHQQEDDFMPRLRAAAEQRALDELGTALDAAKRTAPTRPHPRAPTQPPALAVVAPVAALYDRLRDRLQGRPRT